MAVIARHKWDWDEVQAVMVLIDPLLFALAFWEEDLTIPKSRLDLPEKWRGRQVVSLEQRKMIYDGAVYRLLRDVMPQEASESSRKVAHRTSRKIGKTLFIESTLIQLALTCTSPGTTEGMFHTPRENHMAPVRNRLESKIVSIPLFRMMFLGFDAATGIMNWRTGWIWHFRIEGMCLHGDSLLQVREDSGIIGAWRVRDMIAAEHKPKLLAVDPATYAVDFVDDYRIWQTGEQEVYEAAATDGWTLRATGNHPLLTPSGWRAVDELQPGDMVAVLRALPTSPAIDMLTGDEARLLGYFVGDGGLTNGYPRFTCFDGDVFVDFERIIEQCFPEVVIRSSRAGHYELTCGQRGGVQNPLMDFLRQHDLAKHAYDKRVPSAIMLGPDDAVREFLVGLMATDGSIPQSGARRFVTYSSNSRGLIDDVLELFMRLGVRMRVKFKPGHAQVFPGGRTYTVKDAWEISTSEAEDIIALAQALPIPGVKGDRLQAAAAAYAGTAKAYRVDAVPTALVRREAEAAGWTHNRLSAALGYKINPLNSTPSKHLWQYNTLSRDVVRRINALVQSPVLTNLLDGVVGWRKIKSVTPAGVTQTYDLNVPLTHSFVANGFVVHNSNTGTNMVGLRAYAMIGDEADYSQSAPYIEREQTALPGCAQLWGGVPRGVRGVFWQICNTIEGRSWSVHRYDIRANPLYHSQMAFADQIKGDWYSQRVQTQVLGRDGEEAVSSFPVIPVDSSLHYVVRKFTIKEYEKFKDGLQKFLDIDLAIAQGEDCDAWMIHLDYGYAPSPTQIGISFLKGGLWRLVCRIEIMRVDTTPMANIIATIDTKVLPKRAALIVLDAHGQGRGVLSALHTGEAWDQENYVNRAIPVGFEGSTPVPNVKVHRKCKQPVRQENDGYWSCDTCHNRIFDERELSDAMRQTKSYLTDVLKEDFANGARLLNSAGKDWPGGIAVAIGDDAEIVEELAGTTEIQSQGGSTRYITPKDQDHMTDMLRCLASGAERYVSLMTDWAEFNPNDFGWGDGMFESSKWNAPWGTFSN